MTFIYALRDSRFLESAQLSTRYIGYSEDPSCRYVRHMDESLNQSSDTYKNRWIRSLVRLGLEPVIQVVDVVSDEQVEEAECYWIRFYKEEVGAKLTNATDGGDGLKLTSEAKIRCDTARRRYWESEEACSKHSLRMFDFYKNSVTSEETRAKISSVVKESWLTGKFIGHSGRHHSDAAIKKMSETKKRRLTSQIVSSGSRVAVAS